MIPLPYPLCNCRHRRDHCEMALQQIRPSTSPLGDELDMVTTGFWSATMRDPNTGADTLSPYPGKHEALGATA